jgi:hypothetical protein
MVRQEIRVHDSCARHPATIQAIEDGNWRKTEPDLLASIFSGVILKEDKETQA